MTFEPVFYCQIFSHRKVTDQTSRLSVHGKRICFSIPFCIQKPYRKKAIFYLAFIRYSNLLLLRRNSCISFYTRFKTVFDALFHTFIDTSGQFIRFQIIFICHISGQVGHIKFCQILIFIWFDRLHHGIIDCL